jgi:hypothetical protein
MEETPDQIVERQLRVRQFLWFNRTAKDGDVRPVGVIESRMEPLSSFLALREVLQQQASGKPVPVSLLGCQWTMLGICSDWAKGFAPRPPNSASSGTMPW